ncbi:uncharacterized protein LOC130997253 [Salvia miltiorrhiza]|uniref:uncharacterized protein LOC130997253 n=1 Tax=Salvia miltiorrhiza TaxID=226208 RepID=UPI0025AC4EB1|nr:uncharacterized protein LOC130997253 [Salvia miltiorrhiza]
MANSDDGYHTIQLPPNPSLSRPSSSSPPIPLLLRGFHTSDTIQVRGDTGDLQFSVQFNLRREERRSDNRLDFQEEHIDSRDSVQSPPSSPYLTPTSSTGEFENRNNSADENNSGSSRGGVTTRLRSGALSPVKYYFRRIYGVSGKKRRSSKGKAEERNVFDELLRRRSSPLRPCNSYAFFVMKNWGVVRRSSFVETSKRLSKQWSHLAHDVKKEYEDMALKDNDRYRKQCLLLSNDG